MHGSRISIWFFIGVLLVIYGFLILGAGLTEWATSTYPAGVELNQLHAPVWWGSLLAILGLLYVIKFRPGKNA
ncbi:MAG: hypothetical protein WAL75_16730 [Terracidiphilus sp.]